MNPALRSMALGTLSYTQQLALALKQKSQNGLTPGPAPGFESFGGSRNITSAYDDNSQSGGDYRDAYTLTQSATTVTGSLWSTQPFEQFGVAERNGSNPINIENNTCSTIDADAKLLQSFRHCILKLIELIDRVAAREKFI